MNVVYYGGATAQARAGGMEGGKIVSMIANATFQKFGRIL
jgi:hypothetical protein